MVQRRGSDDDMGRQFNFKRRQQSLDLRLPSVLLGRLRIIELAFSRPSLVNSMDGIRSHAVWFLLVHVRCGRGWKHNIGKILSDFMDGSSGVRPVDVSLFRVDDFAW